MISLRDYFRLLQDVLPILWADTWSSDNYPPQHSVGSQEGLLLTELGCSLTILKVLIVPVLQAFLGGGGVKLPDELPKEIGEKCKVEMKRLLASLETLYRFPSRAVYGYEFPSLEKIRTIYKKGMGEPRSLHILDTTVEKIENATESLRRVLKPYTKKQSTSTEDRIYDISKCPISPIPIRNLSCDFKKRLDSKETWACQCCGPHCYLLFLATHHLVKEKDSHLMLNMFISNKAGQIKWRESMVYAMFPPATGVPREVATNSAKMPRTKGTVSSLCDDVSNWESPLCLRLCFKDSQLFHTKRVSQAQLPWLHSAKTKTLTEILRSIHILSPESRLTLAILIAYAVLYYTGSPWLPLGWNESFFHFLLEKDEETPIILQPLLGSATATIFPKQSVPIGELHKVAGRIDFHRLGIILLELFLNDSIENLRKDEDMIIRNGELCYTTEVDFFTASRVFEEREDDWDDYQNYKLAMEACLELSKLPRSGTHTEFVQYFMSNIINPLENELFNLSNLSAENLDDHIFKSIRESQMGAKAPNADTVMTGQTTSNSKLSTKSNLRNSSTRNDSILDPLKTFNTMVEDILPSSVAHVL
jgi:hypothetical protein